MSVHRYELPPNKAGGRSRVRWRVNIELAPFPDGRRRTTTKRGFIRERDAKDWEDVQRGRAAAGAVPRLVGDRQTAAEYLTTWLGGLALKRTTVASYRLVCEKHLIPHLGGIRLAKLAEPGGVELIDACYRLLEQRGGCRSEPLAPKTVLNAHRVLHRALADAVDRGYLPRNPAALAHPPSTKRAVTEAAVRQIWTPEQFRVWLADVRGDRLYGAWLLLATTGLRRGELAGMPWPAVNLDAGFLEVRQQLTVAANELIWEPSAKTRAGFRRVALDPETVAGLRSLRAAQAAERLACVADYQDHELVVCWPDGRPMHPDRSRTRLQSAARRLGLPKVTVHGLRHSYATAAIEAGVDPKILQERLGHEDVATTLRIYRHVSREAHDEAARKAAKWITG